MDEKIKEMADRLAKSYAENETLKEFRQVVEEIGREGVETVIKALPEESQILFKEALAKSMSMDKEAQEKTGAKVKQVVSEDAREDEDEEAKKRREADKGEKMVKKPGADKISHQGDDTELKGQVIKSEETEEDAEDLEKGDSKAEAEEEVQKGAMKELAFEELEKGELLHKMIEKMRKRGMDHDKVMDALGKKGYDVEMAKGKWADMEEEEQLAKKDEVKKSEEVVAEETIEKVVEEQAAPEEIKKSVNWASPNERLEVNAKRGHNTHYDVDSYIVQKAMDKAAGEPLKKSDEEPKTFDPKNINDILEKGDDRSIDDINQALGHVKKSKGGDFNTSSFSDEDLAKSMGMTVDEMNEVLGVSGKKPKAQS